MIDLHLVRLSAGSRLRVVIDEVYEARGSYGFDTEEETKAAEDHEQAMLDSAQWIVVGGIHEERCGECSEWREVDSLWGIVTENDGTVTETVLESMSLAAHEGGAS